MTLPTTDPFYLDWNFWTALLALIAIVLSQLPPVRLLIRPRRLEVEVHSRINITHKVGNPNVGLVVSIRNTGGLDLRIRGLNLSVSRDGKLVTSMPGAHYFETPSSQASVLFVPFTLKPGESWAHSVEFLNYFDRLTEKAFRESIAHLDWDIRRKLRERLEDDKRPVVGDESLVMPFFELFKRLFIWFPGEYVADLNVFAEPSTATYQREYRFTLFESDTAELREHLEDYRFGVGLTFNAASHGGVAVPLTENGA